MQPVNPGSPRANQPPYPAVLAEQPKRTEAALAAWEQITSAQGLRNAPQVPLQPITATISHLPQNLSGNLYLAKVGTSTPMNEEERRESLRRFLNEWKTLLGADPAQLTLVNDTVGNDGTRTVLFEQRTFPYPLRGDYGKVSVRFAPDRRLIDVSSTAVPDGERIQAALRAAALQVRNKPIDPKLNGRAIIYTDSTGTHTVTLGPEVQAPEPQLVTYPRIGTTTLEMRLAYEINVVNAPVKVVYLDALEDQIIAALP